MLVLTLGLLSFVWIQPVSADFVIRASLIGVFGGVLASTCWQKELRLPQLLLWFLFIAVVLFVGGYYWSRDHAFGNAYRKISAVKLLANYIAAATTIFVGSLLLLKRPVQPSNNRYSQQAKF
jgi:hypothetical protein